MQPQNCPPWEYADAPNARDVLRPRVAELAMRLRTQPEMTRKTAEDTRESHQTLFFNLTPTGFAYYAGHYRGDDFPCLRDRRVMIRSDPLVGAAPYQVVGDMAKLADQIAGGLAALDVAKDLPGVIVSRELKLYYIVVFAARVFVEFLTIHPYLNGNGHMARLVVWAILGRYGYWPKRWPIDPRPADSCYTRAISDYRRGFREPLERYLLQSLRNPIRP